MEILTWRDRSLRADLSGVISGKYAEDHSFYEYNRNESDNPNRTLFNRSVHGGCQRHFRSDISSRPSQSFSQLLGRPVRFWHDQVL